MNPGHQPERFEVFELLPDQRSFTIKDTNYIFHLDKYGGWFDEYGNYYNQDAEPDDPPSFSQDLQSEEQRSSISSEESDQFQKEFGQPIDFSDDEAEEQRDVAAIADNITILEGYPKDTMLRVYFQNLDEHTTKADLATAYGPTVKGIMNIILDQRGGKNEGTGYFIMQDAFTATALINLEGNNVFQRPLFFEVEKYEECLIEPITEQQLNRKEKPKYVLKDKQEQKIETKIDLKPDLKIEQKAELKPEEKQEEEKAQAVWKWYKFEKASLPKRSVFKQWMQQKGLTYEQDFKDIQKINNDPEKKYAKIEMKPSAFNSINNMECQGKKVEFFPM